MNRALQAGTDSPRKGDRQFLGLPTCEQALRFSDHKQVCIATRSLSGDKPEVDIRLLSKCLHNLTPLLHRINLHSLTPVRAVCIATCPSRDPSLTTDGEQLALRNPLARTYG